jgi:chromosome segregation ATPase
MPPTEQSGQTRKSITLWVTALVYLLLLGGAAVAIYKQSRTIFDQAAQLSKRGAENEQLRRQIQQLASTPAAPAGPESPVPAPKSGPRRAPGSPVEELTYAEQRAQRFQDALNQSNTELARLQARINDLESHADAATLEKRGLAAELESSRNDLAEANRTVETVRAELSANKSRLTELESASAKWKQESATAGLSAAQLDQTLSELENLFRRRETYLNNILRRYREVTEQYRSLVGVMDSRRDRQSAPVTSPEISRIQNAISLTEEDIRQIHALDAQAQRLEKKLPSN